jgi:hypothetical protein
MVVDACEARIDNHKTTFVQFSPIRLNILQPAQNLID